MARLPTLPLCKSVWTPMTATQSYGFLFECVAVVLVLFFICGAGRAQNCPVACPSDSKCISGICRKVLSSGRHSGRCTKGDDCQSGKCVNHVCSLFAQRCIQDSECASNNCVDSICADSPKPCVSDSECSPGTCSAGQCIKKRKLPTSKLAAGSEASRRCGR